MINYYGNNFSHTIMPSGAAPDAHASPLSMPLGDSLFHSFYLPFFISSLLLSFLHYFYLVILFFTACDCRSLNNLAAKSLKQAHNLCIPVIEEKDA